MDNLLFPFSEYLWLYLSFTGFVIGLVLLDLGVFHKNAHVVSYREATTWTIIWISLALVFNFLLYKYCLWKFPLDPRLMAIPGFDAAAAAKQTALEFLTGYLVEKSLSIDNIFVFVVIFQYFHIPQRYQHRVLFFGLLGALIFRAIFIAIGSVLMQYHAVIIVFGIFLIFTGIKMMFAPEKPLDPNKNPVIKLVKKIFPVAHSSSGQKFFVIENHKICVTPLFIALIFLEITDVVFAVDSVPAIFAITKEPFIVFTSNIFAILGLRSLYFLLSSAMTQFHMLKYGLAVVLIFVGLKMVWLDQLYNGDFPIGLSLGIIASVIGVSIFLSLILPSKEEKETK